MHTKQVEYCTSIVATTTRPCVGQIIPKRIKRETLKSVFPAGRRSVWRGIKIELRQTFYVELRQSKNGQNHL